MSLVRVLCLLRGNPPCPSCSRIKGLAWAWEARWGNHQACWSLPGYRQHIRGTLAGWAVLARVVLRVSVVRRVWVVCRVSAVARNTREAFVACPVRRLCLIYRAYPAAHNQQNPHGNLHHSRPAVARIVTPATPVTEAGMRTVTAATEWTATSEQARFSAKSSVFTIHRSFASLLQQWQLLRWLG